MTIISHDHEDAALLSQTVVCYEAGRVNRVVSAAEFATGSENPSLPCLL